jgi:hypothetical protein
VHLLSCRSPPPPAFPSFPSCPAGAGAGLLSEELKPRSGLPPLLVNLADRPAERLHYLGVSFGLTQQLYSFWRRSAFKPVYLRQTPSDITGGWGRQAGEAGRRGRQAGRQERQAGRQAGRPGARDCRNNTGRAWFDLPGHKTCLACWSQVLGPTLVFACCSWVCRGAHRDHAAPAAVC